MLFHVSAVIDGGEERPPIAALVTERGNEQRHRADRCGETAQTAMETRTGEM